MGKENVIYTMEYYTAEKNNDFLKFAGKWIDLENIILCDSERQIENVLTHKWLLDIKQRKTSLQFTVSENLDNREDSKRDVCEYNPHGK